MCNGRVGRFRWPPRRWLTHQTARDNPMPLRKKSKALQPVLLAWSVCSRTPSRTPGSSLGEHSSTFAPGQRNTDGGGATGRVGVGNLGRTDGLPGDDANSHFTGQLVINMGEDAASLPPGNNDNPNRGNPNG